MSLIDFQSVYKKYSYHRHKYKLLSETITSITKLNFMKARPEISESEFWALKDVSFNINAGENVGIIGPNGSGKSTILKLIAQITYPSKGKIDVRGRIGAIIELGAGLHPELTGKENIYLYGTILGMRRTEIKNKFSSIVDFAALNKFLDTPIKHYSAGMKARLGFSVAVFMDPDILLVDEVLAVGDAEFQKKSEAKMLEFKKSGKTIIFVSHDMNAIKKVCNRAIYLEAGTINKDGDASKVISAYEKSL